MENNGFQINQIVKGVNAGTFIILGFKRIANCDYAQLKAVNPDDLTETAKGEIALPLTNIKPIDEIQGHNAFVDYVLSFYGAGGLYSFDATAEEIKEALLIRLKQRPDFEFVGDTADRELVRDIIVERRDKCTMTKHQAEIYRPSIVDRLAFGKREGEFIEGDHDKAIELLKPCVAGVLLARAYKLLYMDG